MSLKERFSTFVRKHTGLLVEMFLGGLLAAAVLVVVPPVVQSFFAEVHQCDSYSYLEAPGVSPHKCAYVNITMGDQFSFQTGEGKIYTVKLAQGEVNGQEATVFTVMHPDFSEPIVQSVSGPKVSDTLYAVGDVILQRILVGNREQYFVRYPPDWTVVN